MILCISDTYRRNLFTLNPLANMAIKFRLSQKAVNFLNFRVTANYTGREICYSELTSDGARCSVVS
jgi:hypothetical protein